MSTTNIEWTDEVWNPVTGCTPVSDGCMNCYAKRMSKRHKGRFGYPADDPFRVTPHPDRLDQPLKWKKPRKVFVCSMGDLFHDDVSDEYLDQVFSRILQANHHTFFILTKRPKRMNEYFYSEIANDLNDEEYKYRVKGWNRYYKACLQINDITSKKTNGLVNDFINFNTKSCWFSNKYLSK